MEIIKKDTFFLITSKESSFETFFNEFEKKHTELKENHVVIQISSENNFDEENILVFLKYADLQQQNNKSFIVVCNDVNVDNFPESFNIVPTIVEAKDVIEMEDIQRDLGF
ncbi:hypothetical protein [Tenacibaculum sp. 190524A02b]|uniref:hypothetical protein n=1 Tax=Tenacibaculum vairaonense TaxID=3137860 RepID=UPI0031FB05BC